MMYKKDLFLKDVYVFFLCVFGVLPLAAKIFSLHQCCHLISITCLISFCLFLIPSNQDICCVLCGFLVVFLLFGFPCLFSHFPVLELLT